MIRRIKYYFQRIKDEFQRTRRRLKLRRARKIILGSAGVFYPGWFLTDKDSLDIASRDSFARLWKPNSRSVFLAEHVWEHLNEDEVKKANANCFEFLKPGGRLRIAVPDGLHPDPSYIEYVRPGGTGCGSDDHKTLFDYKLMSQQLRDVGFEVTLLEYWDEDGKFHFQEWSSTHGHISRSKDHDERNKDGVLAYTSLIADAIKPVAS